MKYRATLIVMLLAAGLLAVAAGAADRPADPQAATSLDPRDSTLEPSQRLEALLERCRAEQAAIKTLEAEFEQRKENALLLAPNIAQGVFSYAAPDRVRWEYETPDPISMLITQDELITWYRDLGKVEKVEVGARSQRVLEYLGAGSSLDDLMKYFTVALVVPEAKTEAFRLELEPRFERVAKRLQGLKIWIDSNLYLPVGLRYVEADGDVTEYRFTNYRVNGELPEGRFLLDLPSDVAIEAVDLESRSAAR